MSPGLECDLRNIDVETVSDIAEEAEYMLVSHNFAPERANQTYFKISVILLLLNFASTGTKARTTEVITAQRIIQTSTICLTVTIVLESRDGRPIVAARVC